MHAWMISLTHTLLPLVNFGASCVCPTKIEGYERPENEVIDSAWIAVFVKTKN